MKRFQLTLLLLPLLLTACPSQKVELQVPTDPRVMNGAFAGPLEAAVNVVALTASPGRVYAIKAWLPSEASEGKRELIAYDAVSGAELSRQATTAIGLAYRSDETLVTIDEGIVNLLDPITLAVRQTKQIPDLKSVSRDGTVLVSFTNYKYLRYNSTNFASVPTNINILDESASKLSSDSEWQIQSVPGQPKQPNTERVVSTSTGLPLPIIQSRVTSCQRLSVVPVNQPSAVESWSEKKLVFTAYDDGVLELRSESGDLKKTYKLTDCRGVSALRRQGNTLMFVVRNSYMQEDGIFGTVDLDSGEVKTNVWKPVSPSFYEIPYPTPYGLIIYQGAVIGHRDMSGIDWTRKEEGFDVAFNTRATYVNSENYDITGTVSIQGKILDIFAKAEGRGVLFKAAIPPSYVTLSGSIVDKGIRFGTINGTNSVYVGAGNEQFDIQITRTDGHSYRGSVKRR